MSIEVEVKYRVTDPGGVADRLARLGGEVVSTFSQSDSYYGHPARDFAATDEAFRIRSDDHGNRVTYKGPRQGGPTKTREEIEVPFAEGPGVRADLARVLERLGFRPVATIAKARTMSRLTYRGLLMEVALDRAEGLGDFAEVETIAESEPDVPAAQEAVIALAGALGLADVEPRSYLRMALEGRGRGSSRGIVGKPAGPT